MKFAMTESHFPSYNYWYCAPRARVLFRVGSGLKRAIFRPFFAAGGAKTRSTPQLRGAAGGDVLLTCPGPVAGRRGRHGGARGRKDENPHFRYHSSLNQIVQ